MYSSLNKSKSSSLTQRMMLHNFGFVEGQRIMRSHWLVSIVIFVLECICAYDSSKPFKELLMELQGFYELLIYLKS